MSLYAKIRVFWCPEVKSHYVINDELYVIKFNVTHTHPLNMSYRYSNRSCLFMIYLMPVYPLFNVVLRIMPCHFCHVFKAKLC